MSRLQTSKHNGHVNLTQESLKMDGAALSAGMLEVSSSLNIIFLINFIAGLRVIQSVHDSNFQSGISTCHTHIAW